MVGRSGAEGSISVPVSAIAAKACCTLTRSDRLGAALAEAQQRPRRPRGSPAAPDAAPSRCRSAGSAPRDSRRPRPGTASRSAHARDAAEFLLHIGDEQRDLLRHAAAASAPGSDAADAPPAARAASPPGPRGSGRAAARGGSRASIASRAHRTRPARCSLRRSGRRTCRLPAPACRARRSSRPPAAACANRPRLRPSQPSVTAAARVARRYSAGRRAKKPQSARPRAHRRRRQVPFELALAPVAHQLGQRDLHRADALALAAEGARRSAGGPAWSTPISEGVSTLPIGPGYTQP